MGEPKTTPGYGECFASIALGISPFFLLLGVAGLFGADTVQFNDEDAHGVGALVVALILNVVFAAILAGVQKLGYLILGFIRRMRPAAQPVPEPSE